MVSGDGRARCGEPFSSPGRHQAGFTCIQTYYYMKGNLTNGPEQEPIGIVISRGSRHEDVPRVFAYVWGPAPETSEEPRETKVA
jgi:hypothetical protein